MNKSSNYKKLEHEPRQSGKAGYNLGLIDESPGKSGEIYHTLVNASKDAIIVINSKGLLTLFNPAAEKIFGFKREEMIGSSLDCLMPEEYKERHKEYVKGYFTSGNPHNNIDKTVELPALHRNGNVFPIELSLSTGECDGEPFVLAIIRDITQRKRDEKVLREKERFLDAVFNSIQDGISVLDSELNILRVNNAVRNWFSHILPLEGKKCYEAYHGQSKACEVCHSLRALKTGRLEMGEVFITKANGEKGSLELFAFPILDDSGNPTAVVEYVRDVSSYKESEKTLQTSEKTLKSILRAAPTGVGMVKDRVIKHVNDRFCEMLGYSREELLEQDSRALYLSDEDLEIAGKEKYAQIQKHGIVTVETRLKRKDGQLIDVLLSSTPLDPNDWSKGVTFTALDITERKRAEDKLKESEQNLDAIINTIPDIVYRLDIDGSITFISDAIRKYGYNAEELLGKNILEYVDPEDLDMAVKKLDERKDGKQKATNLEVRLLTKNNVLEGCASRSSDVTPYFSITSEQLYELDETGSKMFIGTQGIARDITNRIKAEKERDKLEAQLMQAYKMEAIGALAGGIAHDFNNILGAILGYAQLAEMDIPENNKSHGYIKQILAASDRAKGLVGQILAFSRQSKPEKIPVDISIIVKEALKLLRASLPANIEIHQKVASNLGVVLADQTQIHQIMMNLCTNALQAMEKNGGQLEVVLAPAELNEEEVTTYSDIKPGRYLKLTVTDSGDGMDSATVDRIFEPYFTTKEPEKGTGLGLAMVHGIVKDHGGVIKVYSEPGSGTSFHLFFPCIEGEANAKANTSEPLSTGTEQILFVDDEKVLVDIGEQMLKKLGYKVDSKTSSYEALEAFKANSEKYDLVITDMTMPKMSGENFAKEILKIRSDIPIIICTGFSNMMSPEKANTTGIKDFLMKPLTMIDLSRSIRNVLDQS